MDTRALLLDVDGTMYHHGQVRKGVLRKLLRAYAVRPVTGYRVVRALRAYRRAQETLRRAPERSGLPLEERQMRAAGPQGGPAVKRWMFEEPLVLLRAARRSGLMETVNTLRARGWKTAAISDYPAAEKLKALGLEVDATVCAQDADVQQFKPSPAGIEAALRRLGVDKRNAIFVGDRAEVDGAAAVAAGIAYLIVRPREPFPAADEIEAKLKAGCSPDG